MTLWIAFLCGAATWFAGYSLFCILQDRRARRKREAQRHINGGRENV